MLNLVRKKNRILFLALVVLATACGRSNPINGGIGGGGNPFPILNFREYCENSLGRYLNRNNKELCEWNQSLYSFDKFKPNFHYSFYKGGTDSLPRLTPASNWYSENLFEAFRNERVYAETGDRIVWSASTQSYWGESNSSLGCDQKIRLNGMDENSVIQYNGTLSNNKSAPQGLIAEAGNEIFLLGHSADYQITGSGGELLIGFNAPTSSLNRCWSIQNWNMRLQHCEDNTRKTIECSQ